MTPEQRTKYLMSAFRWQGGTVHDLCKKIGCDVTGFLYADLSEGALNRSLGSDFVDGWFAIRTCETDHLETVVYPKRRGNLEFWFGVCAGQRLRDEGI